MMKKYIALIAALVVLLLVAFMQQRELDETVKQTQSTEQTTQATNPPQIVLPPETTLPTETTTPMEETTEPTVDLLAEYEAWMAYRRSPEWERYLVFCFSESASEDMGSQFDRFQMKIGRLYAVDYTNVEVHEITTEPCVKYGFDYTAEHIYYVLESEPTKIYRADHYGENHTLMYESEYGNITQLQYCGSNENGKLIMCVEGKRIVSHDISTQATEILMEAFYIEQFYYTPSSRSVSSVVDHISKSEMGVTISWHGKLYEDDPDGPTPLWDSYYYFPWTGEHWDVYTWKPRT